MSNYVKATNFTAKDSLLTGNPAKIIKGAEIDDEFNLIATAIGTKPDSNSPTLTGIPVAPTATAGTNTTQIATTAFVTGVVGTLGTMSTQNKTAVDITGGTVVGITDLAVADGGTGVSTIAANAVVLGNGTSAIQTVAPGTTGNLLTSNGTTWQSTAPAATLGVGQTWTDVKTTPGRVSGTTYTNSTGKPIQVLIVYNMSGDRGGQNGNATLVLNGLSINPNLVITDGGGWGGRFTISFIIPNGNTYSFTVNNVYTTIINWLELR